MPTTTSTKDDLLGAAREAQDAMDKLVRAMNDYQTACEARTREAAALDGKNGLTSASGTARRLALSSADKFANDCMAYLYGSLERRRLPEPTVRNPKAWPPCVDLVATTNTRIAD